jgi:tetratricopeptide (TPR) repeat protein
VQFTHAMLILDADRAGMRDRIDELLAALPSYTVSNQLNIVTRMGSRGHKRFAEALDRVLTDTAAYGDEAEGLFTQLGLSVLRHAPDRMIALSRMMPASVQLYANLAFQAVQAGRRDEALALYDRLLEFPVPDEGDDRTNYLRAMNNACVQAHAAKAYELAVRIADRAQPYAQENPYIYHSAACAYAAVGAFSRAFEQVKLAVEHDYEHLEKVEVDTDLGELLEWPEFKTLFRDWRARKEGN